MLLKPFLLFTFTMAILLTSACETVSSQSKINSKKGDSSQNEPKKITIRANSQTGSTAPAGQTIEKNIVQITVHPKELFLDKTMVKSIKKLERLLKQRDKPVITISAHKCADATLTAQVMSLAQDQTNTPVLYSSFGQFTDPACH